MTPASSVRVCRTCGRSIPAETEFCPHCGARSERPGRSGFTVLLEWLLTAAVAMAALVFGLAGACFLFLGVFEKVTMELLAIGIALLVAAGGLIMYFMYLQRRREARK
jgi:zinc-ribbon domain